MEWNLKHPLQWDWENLALFYEKESEISRSIKQAEWTAEDGIISNESMYSSASGTCSGSVVGNGSSNNSATASVGSSSKAGNKVPETNIEITEGFPENQNSNYEIDLGKKQRAFPVTASCTGAGEPLIGLKLGKRTYFENFASTDIKTSTAVCLLPPASVKRPSICHQSIQHSYCQVEGCNVDLTTAKEYHRKHRVCESHSKSPKVIISGHERRFCQQCSRFHDLSEFDQKKRSCRRRLSEHNARRRKPQPDSHLFHPVKLTSAFYGERGQMDFLPNWTPFTNLRSSASCLRNDSHGFSLSLAKGSWSKPKVVADGQLLLPLDFSNVDTPSCNDLSKLMPLKCATAEVLNQGLDAPASASNLNRAPDLHRALSLLSSDVWIPPSTTQGDTFQLGSSVSDVVSHPTVQVLNSAPACWQQDEHSLTFNIHSSGSQVQELNQLFSTSNGHFLEFRT